MKITNINPIKYKKGYFEIYIEGKPDCIMTEETIFKFKLREGQDIDDEKLTYIKNEDSKRIALDNAWNLLRYRSRSIKELKDHLKNKSFSQDTIDYVIERLLYLNYLDDKRFAREWANKRKQKGIGPEVIRFELQNKGISKDIIDEVLSDIWKSQYEELKIITDIIHKKLKKSKLGKNKLQKIYRFLIRRGFTNESIDLAINKLNRKEANIL